MKTVAHAALAIALSSCRTEQTIVAPDPHLERMIDQPKAMPYGATPVLPNGMTMQWPPEGTLPVDAAPASTLVEPGAAGGVYATRVPVPVDRALLETGRSRFEVLCAACHGILGDGASAVAAHMALRKPPSLLLPPASTDPVGEVFYTILHGYGLMPSYSAQLSDRDAWAVVAYLEALRLAQHARVSALPSDLRERLAREAP